MFFAKISNKEIVEFNKTLSLMLMSRLSIVQSLELLTTRTKNKAFIKITKEILKSVRAGNSLTKSFKKYPAIFDEIYLANLRVSEESGQVAEVLSDYTKYLESMEDLKRKIVQAVRYPVLVLILGTGVISFMVFFLIPTFESLFFSSKLSLPALTYLIITISNNIKENIFSIILVLILVIFLVYKSKNTTYFKAGLDKLLLKFPIISGLYKENLLSRFALSMATLLNSKITLVDSLKIAKNISGNIVFRTEVEGLIKRLLKGESFSANITKSDLFDITFSKLLTAGEESAELGKVFRLISGYYSKEFDYHMDNFTSLIEPFLIVFVGLIVAIILVSMYLPMFELINNFGV